MRTPKNTPKNTPNKSIASPRSANRGDREGTMSDYRSDLMGAAAGGENVNATNTAVVLSVGAPTGNLESLFDPVIRTITTTNNSDGLDLSWLPPLDLLMSPSSIAILRTTLAEKQQAFRTQMALIELYSRNFTELRSQLHSLLSQVQVLVPPHLATTQATATSVSILHQRMTVSWMDMCATLDAASAEAREQAQLSQSEMQRLEVMLRLAERLQQRRGQQEQLVLAQSPIPSTGSRGASCDGANDRCQSILAHALLAQQIASGCNGALIASPTITRQRPAASPFGLHDNICDSGIKGGGGSEKEEKDEDMLDKNGGSPSSSAEV